MSPEAEPASHARPARAAVPADLIEDGEAVILAIKPSGWFVLLHSWPVLVVLGLVALVAYVAADLFGSGVPTRAVLLFCSGVACARLIFACWQWQGRLYLLTDRRVVWLRGTLRVELRQCPLRSVRQTHLSTRFAERRLGLGSLFFAIADGDISEPVWIHIARPAEIQAVVDEAVRRAR